MTAPATLRDRLSSAAAAIALQVGLFGLLAVSFQMVRDLPQEKETILNLPPLQRPHPPPEATVIDGRRRPPPARAAPLPVPPAPLSLYVLPRDAAHDTAILQALGRSLSNCTIGKYADLTPSDRQDCPPPAGDMARRDDKTVPLNPPSHVRDEPYWQGELARKNGRAAIPGGDPLGAALVLLFDPGAFAEKRSYSAAPEPEKVSGAEYQRRLLTVNPACPISDSNAQAECARETGALYMHDIARW